MDINYLKDKKIVVTGGAGFLGKALIEKLSTYGADVFSFDIIPNKDVLNSILVDITDEKNLQLEINRIHPDFVFHLAAKIDRTRDFSKSKEIFKINFDGTVNLLNSLRGIAYTNFIFASTSEIYGLNTNKPFKETDELLAASPYSLSKINAENAIKTFSKIYKKNYTILRLFNFYSQGMPSGFFISDLVEKLEKNENFDMTLGEQKRDFLKTESIVEALILSTKKEALGETYNVCSGNGFKIKDLAEKFKHDLNSLSEINFGALPYRKNEIWEMIGDNSKIKRELDWIPKELFE
ncbi:NAD(P)-dependent oxidoreductase [Winogradskyella sp.]|uniref:NAD-dependent epimerase/dehydratase family protein n=1 Tax=Winogradskyella sp. TaxID=1883156 RepID=UPI00261630EB|nr:GDP-mannose 4,6-dehydratase [Winogradskyella sp.]